MTHDQAINLQQILFAFLALDAVLVVLFFGVVWRDIANSDREGRRRRFEAEEGEQWIEQAEQAEQAETYSTLDDIAAGPPDHCPYCNRRCATWHDQYTNHTNSTNQPQA